MQNGFFSEAMNRVGETPGEITFESSIKNKRHENKIHLQSLCEKAYLLFHFYDAPPSCYIWKGKSTGSSSFNYRESRLMFFRKAHLILKAHSK